MHDGFTMGQSEGTGLYSTLPVIECVSALVLLLGMVKELVSI